jgi:C1A family cysteine protease
MSAEETALYQYETISAAEQEFMQFVAKYGRTYGTKAEYQFRLNEFSQKLAEIEAHNSRNGETSTMGINQFADYTKEELKRLNGLRLDLSADLPTDYLELDTSNLADEVNWVTKGGVTPVKNQGQCGSCWSFSTTGAMEGAHFVATGDLVSLSEKNLMDCSILNHSCNGGSMALAFLYAERHPLETEADYPYAPVDGKCQYNKSKGVVKVTKYSNIKANSPADLKAAIAQGPVSVAIEADQSVFQLYTGGVLTSSACGTQLDHGVLAVGYGTDATAGDYYLVKNSWGPSWGDQGYIKIGVADGQGICGIQMMPILPTTD